MATERGVRRLFAMDEAAAALGLFAGQKAADATALAPELATDEADPAADRAALEALCDWCVRFSPAVAPDPPDGLFLDITGVSHLWGGEAPMARDLVARLAASGIPARAAAAASPGAAWALARQTRCLTIAPVGREAELLAPLPIAALRLAAPTAAQIARLGLTTIGAIADLPRAELTRRFGGEVVLRLDQAMGRAKEALAFRRPPSPWFARLAFAEPISVPEDLARASADIAALLCARLEAAGKGAARFELAFHRLDGRAERLAIGLAMPGREASRIARLFAPLLERVDPGFGIEVVTLATDGAEPLVPRQLRLDEDRAADLEASAPLVDRLANRLGEEKIWRDEAFPSHIPERSVIRRPPLSPVGETKWDTERPRPLRLFRRPEPIEAVAPVPDDPPLFFRWRGLAHKVRRSEGPERLAEEWWRRPFEEAGPGKVRDYYRVEDEAGARFWLFRDGLYEAGNPPRWWLHGLFG
jgi:protein ImuB